MLMANNGRTMGEQWANRWRAVGKLWKSQRQRRAGAKRRFNPAIRLANDRRAIGKPLANSGKGRGVERWLNDCQGQERRGGGKRWLRAGAKNSENGVVDFAFKAFPTKGGRWQSMLLL